MEHTDTPPAANPNIAIKDRFVEAVFSGDEATLRTLIHPDFTLHQPPGLPYEGDYAGADGFMVFLEKFMAAYELESLDQTALFIEQDDPNALVLGFDIKGTLSETGRPFVSPQLERWDYCDGQIVQIRVFWFTLP